MVRHPPWIFHFTATDEFPGHRYMESALTCRVRILLLSFAILGASSAARAQGQTALQPEMHGQVDRADGSPFRDIATVTIEDTLGGQTVRIVTDSSGTFDAPHLRKSHFTVTVHAPGFRDATTNVDLVRVPRAYVRLTLKELPPSASPATPPAPIVSVNDLNVPEAAQVEFEKGRGLLLDKHKSADSVKSFLKAIQIAPTYSQAYFLLGTAYMDMGKWSDAEAALNQAISSNDKLQSAYLALGSSLVEEKKFAEAEKPLLRGLEFLPDASHGHYDLGRTYYSLNRFQEAEPHARKAVELEPNFPEAHILLGNVLLRLRDGQGALAEFQEYLRLAPNGSFAAPTQELVKKLTAALAAPH
jgi:Tfp pilus assembly protein PilF